MVALGTLWCRLNIIHARKSIDRERSMGFTMQSHTVTQVAPAGVFWARGVVYTYAC